MKKRNFILILLFATSFSGEVSAQERLRVTFRPSVALNENKLFIRDLVDPDQTDLDFIKEFGSVSVTDDEDDSDYISRAQLYSALNTSGANLSAYNFSSTGGVAVERGQKIELSKTNQDKIVAAIAKGYGITETDIVIKSARISPRFEKVDNSEPHIRRINSMDLNRLSQAVLSVDIEDLNGETAEHKLYLALNIETTVMVARETIGAEESITPDHFISGRQKIKSLGGKVLSVSQLKNKNFKTVKEVSRDAVLLNDMIRESVVVKEGSPVSISYKTPFLNIKAMGKLLMASEIGKVVRVENIDSKRTIEGKLVSQDLVEVISE